MDWKPLIEAVRDIPQLELATHSLAPGETLFEQGEASGSMFLLESGRLESAIAGRGESESVPVGSVGPGDLVGEIGWLCGTRRNATVQALEQTSLVEVPAEAFEILRAENHPALEQIGALLDQRQRQGTLVRSSQPVADGLTAWWQRRGRDQRDVDVVLLVNARSTLDLRLSLPWLADLGDAELTELSRWMRPVFGEILQSEPSSVGMLFLPRLVQDLMDPQRRRECRRLVAQDSISLARENGAKVLCLGGLTASLMKYGRLLDGVADDIAITTGHTVTSISCVRTMAAAIDRFGLEPEGEQLAVLGMGSVGSAFLELVLTQPWCPRSIVLSDLPEQRQSVQALIDRLVPDLPAGVKLSFVPSSRDGLAADHPVYNSRYVFSATSAADVIDVDQVMSGTLLVDDSQPHCWSRERAFQRVQRAGDIIPCEAGLIDCESLSYRSFFPFDWLEDQHHGTTHAWCCLTEGLLLGKYPELPPTIGEPTLASMLAFDEAFVDAGLKPAPLRSGPYLLDDNLISL